MDFELVLSELWPFSSVAFYIDKRIVRGIAFYKRISSFLLLGQSDLIGKVPQDLFIVLILKQRIFAPM